VPITVIQICSNTTTHTAPREYDTTAEREEI
jgi:hypothetical protein